MPDTDPHVEDMISTWLGYANLWADAEVGPEMNRDYISSYVHNRMTIDPRDRLEGDFVLSAYLSVTDELVAFELLGVFEEGKLVYLTACVDTDWREVWSARFPTGLIDMSKPYAREGQYLHTPDRKDH